MFQVSWSQSSEELAHLFHLKYPVPLQTVHLQKGSTALLL